MVKRIVRWGLLMVSEESSRVMIVVVLTKRP